MYTMTLIPKMLTIRQAAEAFNVSSRTLRGAIERGYIAGYHPNGRTVLVKAPEVLAWMESTRCGGAEA